MLFMSESVAKRIKAYLNRTQHPSVKNLSGAMGLWGRDVYMSNNAAAQEAFQTAWKHRTDYEAAVAHLHNVVKFLEVKAPETFVPIHEKRNRRHRLEQ
jgi:hypothetical protein